MGYDEMVERLRIAICQFAKRQMTWFRGMEKRGIHIHWIDNTMDTDSKVDTILSLLKHHTSWFHPTCITPDRTMNRTLCFHAINIVDRSANAECKRQLAGFSLWHRWPRGNSFIMKRGIKPSWLLPPIRIPGQEKLNLLLPPDSTPRNMLIETTKYPLENLSIQEGMILSTT